MPHQEFRPEKQQMQIHSLLMDLGIFYSNLSYMFEQFCELNTISVQYDMHVACRT